MREKVARLLREGKPVGDIAKEVGIAESTVRRWAQGDGKRAGPARPYRPPRAPDADAADRAAGVDTSARPAEGEAAPPPSPTIDPALIVAGCRMFIAMTTCAALARYKIPKEHSIVASQNATEMEIKFFEYLAPATAKALPTWTARLERFAPLVLGGGLIFCSVTRAKAIKDVAATLAREKPAP